MKKNNASEVVEANIKTATIQPMKLKEENGATKSTGAMKNIKDLN